MKSNLDTLFLNDENLEADGIWMHITDEVGFRVRRFGGFNAPKVKKAMAQYFKPYSSQIQNNTISQKKEQEILTRVFVESCITDWTGVEIDGAPVKFAKEIAVKFLTGLPELVDSLMAYAQDSKNFRVEMSEGKEDLGNS